MKQAFSGRNSILDASDWAALAKRSISIRFCSTLAREHICPILTRNPVVRDIASNTGAYSACNATRHRGFPGSLVRKLELTAVTL